MRTVPRGSVRISLAVTILLTIILSWVLSTGIANYLNFVNVRALHREMLKRPDLYPQPIPEPHFGVMDFLLGRSPVPMGPRPMLPPNQGIAPGPGVPAQPPIQNAPRYLPPRTQVPAPGAPPAQSPPVRPPVGQLPPNPPPNQGFAPSQPPVGQVQPGMPGRPPMQGIRPGQPRVDQIQPGLPPRPPITGQAQPIRPPINQPQPSQPVRPPAVGQAQPNLPPNQGITPGQPPIGEPGPRGPQGPPPRRFEWQWLVLRLVIALTLAIAAGAWLARKYTKPLMDLADGAKAFHSGDFRYRIPTDGGDEFADVATAMNEMARRVSEQIGHLEEDADRRRQFMADIAHELRSPVTTMRTMAGALQDGIAAEPERRERAVAALVGTSERLLRLVQDLMELAKLDLNELPLNVKQVDLRELIGSVIQSHEAEASAVGIVLHPPDDVPSVRASVDPDRMTQVLDNILDNAVSYAGEGAHVKVLVQDANPIAIQVRDTGKGVPAADLPYIFDSFYRADAARTPGEYHSGLGLSIARKLVEAHGGKLTVASAEGKGTTVTISIPKTK